MSDIELNAIRNNFFRHSPEAYQLAKLVSLAVQIEPELLRIVRLKLLPHFDAGIEADIWLSPLIQYRSSIAVVFFPEVATHLRRELAQDQELLNDAWKVLHETHSNLPSILQLEEKLTWLAISDIRDARQQIDETLLSVLAAICTGNRPGLEKWTRQAQFRLPTEIVSSSEVFQLLPFFVKAKTQTTSELNIGSNLLKLLRGASVEGSRQINIGVRLFDGEVEFSRPPMRDAHLIEIPEILPVLKLVWQDSDNHYHSLYVEINSGVRNELFGEMIRKVRIETVTGTEYVLVVKEEIKNKAKEIFSTISYQEKPELSVSRVISERFIGRASPLEVFYERFAYRHMKNGVYYFGPRGAGKTWLLKKILLDSQSTTRIAKDIIDFFNTQNQSIFGVQSAIRSRLEPLGNLDVFAPYDNILTRIHDIHRGNSQKEQELVAGLEARASKVFIECCNNAIVGNEVTMLFDSFESVQQLFIGQWFMHQFLRQVKGLIVVICGRSASPDMPDNILTYELQGFDLEEIAVFVKKFWSRTLPSNVLEALRQKTRGNPLLVRLVLDQCSASLPELEKFLDIKDENELHRKLAEAFVNPTPENKLIWVMAFFRRRFNLEMLHYLVHQGKILNILGLTEDGYNQAIQRLENSPFVKEYSDQQRHLLHDEVQVIVEKYVIGVIFVGRELDQLFDVIVRGYYPEAIEKAEALSDNSLAKQLRAEQLGYILRQHSESGIQLYNQYLRGIEETHNYDFEELLWGEMRSYQGVVEKNFELFKSRGEWLIHRGLFGQAANHLREMEVIYPGHESTIYKMLGLCLMRLGEFEQAINIFERGLTIVKASDKMKGEFENLLGHAYISIGRWDEALVRFTQAINYFSHTGTKEDIAGVYINRSYIYSLQGMYNYAIEEANRALQISLSLVENNELNNKQQIYVYIALGTAHRYSGSYEQAAGYYKKALDLANSINNPYDFCNTLQHLGINGCMQVRMQRQKGNYLDAATHLSESWNNITQALAVAYQMGWLSMIGNGLSRLARVYEEIYRLNKIAKDQPENIASIMILLQKEASEYEPRTEMELWNEFLLQPFHELDLLGKSAKLFELSALVADEANDFHRALDSLMELARLLIEMERFDLVPIVCRRTERIKGYDYQEDLFSAMNELVLADLNYSTGNLDKALQQYAANFAKLSKLTGYASFLFIDRLRLLKERLILLPKEICLKWCEHLEATWLSESAIILHPDLLRMLEDVRYQYNH